MAFDFPGSPIPGQIYTIGSIQYVWNGYAWAGGGSAPLPATTIVSDTPPANPRAGETWWESDTGILFMNYNDGNGPAQWVQINAVGMPSALTHGQCRFRFETPNVVLRPYNGRWLIINGRSETVPGGGVSLNPTGLVAATVYYIYAYMNAGVMTLEASLTGHSTHTDGVEIKTGDPTRTLVGMSRTGAAGTWNGNTNLVNQHISWFNRSLIVVSAAGSGAITSLSPVEFTGSSRVFALNWAGEAVNVTLTGVVYQSAIGTPNNYLFADDTIQLSSGAFSLAGASYYYSPAQAVNAAIAEGHHFYNFKAAASSGTLTAAGYLVTATVWG